MARSHSMVLAGLIFLVGCGGSPSAFKLRVKKDPKTWKSLSAEQRKVVRKGSFTTGMPEGAATLARGKARWTWATKIGKKACTAALFASDGSNNIDVAAFMCGGKIKKIYNLTPQLDGNAMAARSHRVIKDWDYFAGLDHDKQLALMRGKLAVGDAASAYDIAIGDQWEFRWFTTIDGKSCHVTLHSTVQNAVNWGTQVCEDKIVRFDQVNLPLASLRARVKRLLPDKEYFNGLPLATQWEVVEGVVQKGQTHRALRIAWGPPYRSSVSGNVTREVFLDGTGEYFGTTVIITDSHVTGWEAPTEWVLTPEASARRIAAEEERQRQIAEQEAYLAELDRQAAEQARAAEQAERDRQARDQRDAQQAQQQPQQRRVIRVNNQRSSAQRTITINGQTFTGGEHLGRPCSGQCPDGYRCYIVTGNSGQCVQ